MGCCPGSRRLSHSRTPHSPPGTSAGAPLWPSLSSCPRPHPHLTLPLLPSVRPLHPQDPESSPRPSFWDSCLPGPAGRPRRGPGLAVLTPPGPPLRAHIYVDTVTDTHVCTCACIHTLISTRAHMQADTHRHARTPPSHTPAHMITYTGAHTHVAHLHASYMHVATHVSTLAHTLLHPGHTHVRAGSLRPSPAGH